MQLNISEKNLTWVAQVLKKSQGRLYVRTDIQMCICWTNISLQHFEMDLHLLGVFGTMWEYQMNFLLLASGSNLQPSCRAVYMRLLNDRNWEPSQPRYSTEDERDIYLLFAVRAFRDQCLKPCLLGWLILRYRYLTLKVWLARDSG